MTLLSSISDRRNSRMTDFLNYRNMKYSKINGFVIKNLKIFQRRGRETEGCGPRETRGGPLSHLHH